MYTKFLILALFHSSSAVIYELNDADYALMPPIFHMDDYEECLKDPMDLYCTVDFSLVSDEPSTLLSMMQDYSEHIPTHYNHTLLRHGVCITRTCKKYYEASKGDLRLTLEACANETFYNKYKLKVRVSNACYCSKSEKNQPVDVLDLALGMVCVAILIANFVASICDYYFNQKGKVYRGLRLVYCFSIFRNWNRLVGSPIEGKADLQELRGLHGFRAISTVLVIAGHSSIVSILLPENTVFIENLFSNDLFHIILNGTLIMQTFLIIASFLLVYNWLIYSEKQEPSWKMLPKQFMMRWLRLTPTYALILGLTATWFGRITSGPYWKIIVGQELSDCRRDWWRHFLYINNYFDDSGCMVQAWYLAADTQLYFVSAIVFVTFRTVRMRKVVLSLLFVLGVIGPTVQTYYQNLDGIMVFTPEFALRVFKGYPTFDKIYKRGHSNLTASVIGIATAYMVFEWKKTGRDPKILHKFRPWYWALFPMACLCCYSGTVFYSHSPPPSLAVNLLFAAFLKPVFGILIGIIIVGVIIQFEGVYRAVLEWNWWRIPSQLSFCAYLLHIAIMRNYIAMQTSTCTISASVIVTRGIIFIISSFVAALVFWLLVEAPFGNVIRECFTNSEPIEKKQSGRNELKPKSS